MEELLIEKVRMYGFLYNIKSPSYRDHSMRQTAWEEIGRDLNIKAQTAKNTWDKLRRCYLNAINRRRNKNSGQAAKKIPPWKFEYQMSFLLQFIKTHNTVREEDSHYDSSYDEINDTQEPEINVGEISEYSEHSYIDPHEDITVNVKEEVSDDQDECTGASNNPIQNMVLLTKEKSSLKKPKYREGHSKDIDETILFFLSMAKMTKKLPPLEQAKIKLQLSNAVLLAQIKMNESQQNRERPPSTSESVTTSNLTLSPQIDSQTNSQVHLKQETLDSGAET